MKKHNRTTLKRCAFTPLPLGSIAPRGWLKNQLRIQADGLGGHLDEVWPDVMNSAWFGGKADGWERAPYWLDGVIPLAFVLDDARLKQKVKRHVEYIITHQHKDGWLGPCTANAEGIPADAGYDLWALLLACKMLVQYHDATGNHAACVAVEKCLAMLARHLRTTPLFNWGKYRWFEGLVSIFHVHDRTPRKWLLDLARLIHAQGFDWRQCIETNDDMTVPTPRRGMWKWHKHVVNLAMALKAGALWWRLSGDAADRASSTKLIAFLDRYHGQASGVFSGDECVAGRSPIQGTELCAVVEYLFSLEQLIAISGDPACGDRLEKIAFNALPATFSPDMWAHQYDQQANQVQCTINGAHQWTTNGPESNLYGLEPGYGCCTANLSQGWPKFAAHLWMRTQDGGVAAVAYAPSAASFMHDGTPVTITLDTGYPFRSKLDFSIKTGSATRFPLLLRIPAWTVTPAIKVNGKRMASPEQGTFHRIDRVWRSGDTVSLELPMKPAVTRRYNNAVSLERGPLVYSLRIGEKWKQVNKGVPCRERPHADWEVTPTTPWNYALDLDERNPAKSVSFTERPIGRMPFSPEGAPVVARIRGRKVPGWALHNGWAAETPIGPVHSTEPGEKLELVPYGCTNLRITEFPV